MDPRLRRSVAHLVRPGIDLSSVRVLDLGDDEHHLRKVLRVTDGDPVSVTDGAGGWLPCAYSDGALHADGEPQHIAGSSPSLCVAFVPVKGERTEWTVEKLVEIGVDEIIVLAPTMRSVVRWDDRRATSQHERLTKTVLAAVSQSRRTWLPSLRVGVAFDEVIARPGAALADPDGEPFAEAAAAGVDTLVVGPEGGFDSAERSGHRCVTIAPGILRAETAALVAGAVMVTHRAR